jgi:hypothetical protein
MFIPSIIIVISITTTAVGTFFSFIISKIVVHETCPAFFIVFSTGWIFLNDFLPARVIALECAGEFVLVVSSPGIPAVPILVATWGTLVITLVQLHGFLMLLKE